MKKLHRRRLAGIAVAVGLVAAVGFGALPAGSGATPTHIAAAAKTATKGCSQYNFKHPPATPVAINIAGTIGAESYSGYFGVNLVHVIEPGKLKYYGKWYLPTLDNFTVPTDRVTAFAAGQVNAFLLSVPASLAAYAASPTFQLVASLVQIPYHGAGDAPLMVLSSSGITSVSQLAGKSVGVYGLGSTNQLALDASIKAAGGNPASVTAVNVTPAGAMAALQSGQVAATYFVEPYWHEALATGDVKVLATEVGGIQTAYPKLKETSGLDLYMSKTFLKQNPEAVCAYLADMQTSFKLFTAQTKLWRNAWVANNYVVTTNLQEYLALPFAGLVPTGRGPVTANVTSDKDLATLGVKLGLIPQADIPNWSQFVWPLAAQS